jgi:ribosomal protein S12 methylthiotransferase accessory factor
MTSADLASPFAARLADCFDQFELGLEDCPAWFSVALPSTAAKARWPRFPVAATPSRGRTASGRGLTAAACRASCLGEAAELISCCAWGNERLVYATAAELGARALAPEKLNGLSSDQNLERDRWNAKYGAFDWRPSPVSADAAYDWMEIEDAYSGAVAYAPADFVLIGRREAGDEQAVAVADSNGCACAESLELARASAVLELIERDAVGRWWYGRRARRTADVRTIRGADPLVDYLVDRQRVCRLVDITTDVGIPAFAAVSCEPDGRDVAIGSAAGLEAEPAALSALTEMLQMEISLATVRRVPEASHIWNIWRREVSLATPPLCLLEERALHLSEPSAPAAAGLARILEACRAVGVSLYFADLTRPEVGLPVVRALSADFCHYKPRFGKSRLLAPDDRDLGDFDEAFSMPNPQLLLT